MGRAIFLPGAGPGLGEEVINLAGGTVCPHPRGLLSECGRNGRDGQDLGLYPVCLPNTYSCPSGSMI